MLKTKAVVKKPATVVKAKAKAKPVAVKKPTVVKTKTKAKPVAVKKPAVAKAKPRKQYKGGSIPQIQIDIVDKIIRKFVEYSNKRYGDMNRNRYDYSYIATDEYKSDITDIISNIRKLNEDYIDVDTIKQADMRKVAASTIDYINGILNNIVIDIIQEFLFNDNDPLDRPNYIKYATLYHNRDETPISSRI
jgi:hypothetical protein